MAKRKWEFTGETKICLGGTLKRIRAAIEFNLKCGITIAKGELGGWIEGESNLSGDAWVSGDAEVSGNAKVFGDALVSGDAKVYENVEVSGNALVYGNAQVFGNAKVSGDALVNGNAKVYGNAWVSGNAKVFGDAEVCGYAEVCGDAEVCGKEDYMVLKNSWSSGRWFTYTRSNGMWKVGCFYGTGESLVAKAYRDSELSGKCYEEIVRAVEAIHKAVEESKG